jgi:large subunit ribosomal protein L1
MSVGKRIADIYTKIDKNQFYSLTNAVDLIKNFSSVKFNESVDIAINLNVNPRRAEQNIRSTVVLPNGTGKTKKILVIAKADKLKEAEDAGADYFGSEELMEKVAGGWMDFDVLISTPDMMKDLGKLGKVLGPRGLMPNPKAGTVTFDIKKAVAEVKLGKIEFRVDEYGIIHLAVGKVSFDQDKLVENIKVLIDTILKLKPSTVKGSFVKSVILSSTMGPGIKLDLIGLINK